MISQVSFSVSKGLYWERVIVVKDRVSRRVVNPIDAWATVRISASSNKSIPCTIENGNGIRLALSEEETSALPVGDLAFDVVAIVRRRSASTEGGWAERTVPVAAGILKVTETSLVSSTRESDDMELEIKFAKGEDFYTSFVWKDGDGNTLPITSAYMQAKDTAGATVIDLRWFVAPPDEAAMTALPGNQRGYLTLVNSSLELHISDVNSVPAGTYPYDVFVQGAADQWTRLVRGYVIIEPSVSTRP